MGEEKSIPTEDLVTVSRNIAKIGTSVIKMEGTVNTIKDDLLPPVVMAAKEARDGFLILTSKVKNLESAPPPKHECEEKSHQAKQDSDIAETKTKTTNVGKIVWWLMGIAIVVGGSAVSFATFTRGSTTENSTRIESHGRDLARHEREINAVEKAQQADRETYLREMRELPNKVKSATKSRPLTIEAMEEASRGLPLTKSEQYQLRSLLKKAKRRSIRRINGGN